MSIKVLVQLTCDGGFCGVTRPVQTMATVDAAFEWSEHDSTTPRGIAIMLTPDLPPGWSYNKESLWYGVEDSYRCPVCTEQLAKTRV